MPQRELKCHTPAEGCRAAAASLSFGGSDARCVSACALLPVGVAWRSDSSLLRPESPCAVLSTFPVVRSIWEGHRETRTICQKSEGTHIFIGRAAYFDCQRLMRL